MFGSRKCKIFAQHVISIAHYLCPLLFSSLEDVFLDLSALGCDSLAVGLSAGLDLSFAKVLSVKRQHNVRHSVIRVSLTN